MRVVAHGDSRAVRQLLIRQVNAAVLLHGGQRCVQRRNPEIPIGALLSRSVVDHCGTRSSGRLVRRTPTMLKPPRKPSLCALWGAGWLLLGTACASTATTGAVRPAETSLAGGQTADPVPLAPPNLVPPPPELADQLHFNDWVLAYVRNGR